MAIHIVNSGESLWEVSALYRIPVSTIVEVNGLTSVDNIVPGLSLYIPDNGLSMRYVQVMAGDSLWKLAERYRTTISEILKVNPAIKRLGYLLIGQRLYIPSPAKLSIHSLGFIVPYYPERFLKNFDQLADRLTYMAIAAFSFTAEGYAYVILNDLDIISRSWERNVTPLLMIRNLMNGEFSAELIGGVLENSTYRNNLVASIVQLAKERNYGGVSIDFEFIPPQRRANFIVFLENLKEALGDLLLHVNVHAKREDLPMNRIVGGYDYRAIGNVADFVAIMTIDYGYPTGPPEAIAPIWWIEQVLQYAAPLINPSKIQIAFALYGYDKIVPTNETRALSVQDAQNQAIAKRVVIQYDSYAEAPWYQYWNREEEHIVYFEDIRSYMRKYQLIDVYELAGATFWQLNLSAPQNWAFMRNHVNILKT